MEIKYDEKGRPIKEEDSNNIYYILLFLIMIGLLFVGFNEGIIIPNYDNDNYPTNVQSTQICTLDGKFCSHEFEEARVSDASAIYKNKTHISIYAGDYIHTCNLDGTNCTTTENEFKNAATTYTNLNVVYRD